MRDVLVAGTRGTPSYLVAGRAGADANFSVAHGAGRRMSRADALRRGQAKHTVQELRRTPLGSLVVCGDRQLLFELQQARAQHLMGGCLFEVGAEQLLVPGVTRRQLGALLTVTEVARAVRTKLGSGDAAGAPPHVP